MTGRRRIVLELLQWYGLLGAPLAWTAMHVAGFGVTQAACGVAGSRWQLSTRPWEGVLLGVTAAAAVGAFVSAARVWRATRGSDANGVAELTEVRRARLHFLATASLVVGILFTAIILLGGLGSIAVGRCPR